MYPGYKFNPESKADKQKRRAAKAAQKELQRANSKRGRARAAPYVVPVVATPPSGHPIGYPYDPAALYGDAGPSPHLSAASSPTSSKSASLPLPPVDERPQLYPAHSSIRSSPGSDAHLNSPSYEVLSPMTPDMFTAPMPPAQAPHPDLIRQRPTPGQYQAPSQQQQQQPQQQMPFAGELMPWMHNPANHGQVPVNGIVPEVGVLTCVVCLI